MLYLKVQSKIFPKTVGSLKKLFLPLIVIATLGAGLFGTYAWGFARGGDAGGQNSREDDVIGRETHRFLGEHQLLLCHDALARRRAMETSLGRWVISGSGTEVPIRNNDGDFHEVERLESELIIAETDVARYCERERLESIPNNKY